MRDISNFGNNLRDEIIEYRLEHETGYTLKIKFVDSGDKTTARLCLYSKTGEFLSETEEFPFDPAGQRVIDSVKLIKGSSEGHEAEYEIKVLFRGGKDPIYCPVDDILTTLRKQLSNKVTIDLDNSKENESSVITSKIYSDFSKDKNEEPLQLAEDHISLDDIKMTAQNISMIADAESEVADAESEEAKPISVFVADVKDKKVTVYDLDVINNININKAKINALEVTGDVTVGHRLETKGLETKGSADFRSDVSVNGTLMATSLAAANNTLSVNDSSVSVIGNTSINGDITLTNHEREVSLTESDFTINLMGNSDASVTNKKYVNDLVKTERERATNAENDMSSSLDAKTTELRSAIEQEISDREEAVATEKDRAETKENDLDERLTAEVARAKEEESEISSNLTNETTRASAAENALDKKITDSVNSLTSTINEFKDKEQTDVDNLKRKLDAEVDRASGVESTLTANLANEVTRATAKETELSAAISAEITRAKAAESTLSNDIQAEVSRADAAEKANTAAIDAEESRATTAENTIKGRLDIIEGEGEGSIKKAVKAESTRAKAEESSIASNLATEVSRATGAEAGLESSIGTTNSNLEKAKKDLNKLITDETTRATGEETKLSNSISSLSTSISNEIEDRKNAITKEASDRNAAISNSISQEVIDRNAAIAQERDRAVEAERQLQTNIAAEITRATGAEEAVRTDLATYAKSLELIGGKDTNYVYTFTLKDSNGTTLNEYSIDLPIESVVVGGTYDAGNKKVILTLDNGKEISFSVADLIKGLVSDATFNEHANNKNNPHGVTKAQVGLGNVDNTSDANKPVSKATQSVLNNKVDKEAGKSLISDTEITRLAGMKDGANKVEASTNNGKIKIDGKEVSVYVESKDVVHDKDYYHVSVSKSDGVTSNNITYKYDDTALSNSIESAKTDISELQTRLSSLDDTTISKIVNLVSNLNDAQINALVAFAQSLNVVDVE